LIDEDTYPLFVDIGAYDGETISNSRAFRLEKDWSLVLVDANKEACNQAVELYKDDNKVIVLREFITHKKGLYGYLDLDPAKWGLAKVKTHTVKNTKYTKKCITLSELLNSLNIKEVGILSIDIEGTELDVLEELFFNSVIRPQIICVEANTIETEKSLKKFLLKEYKFCKKLGVNLIFKKKIK
jgi:FkbM family methyltransferase